MEVTLEQMLLAREERAFRQTALLAQWGLPLVSFCLNIPGPVKDSPAIRRGFFAGTEALEHSLPPQCIRQRQIFPAVTGYEGVYVVDMDPVELKRCTTQIEDAHPLGRLFDLDVIAPDGRKLDRQAVGGGSRDCIVCGAPGRGCASRRAHSVAQLQEAVDRILTAYFQDRDARQIGALAVESLLREVATTPKPGLVDRNNTGSHRDMDLAAFQASAQALAPYFHRCAAIGIQTREQTPEQTFAALRREGLQAEQTMYQATCGVNTHKGAIFTIGILCGAAGRLWTRVGAWQETALFRQVRAMTEQAMARDWQNVADTAGSRLYARYGVRGIRGEVAQGLPSVAHVGLPAWRACLAQGMEENMAGATTLLHLIARVEDTNMLSRGGPEGAREGARRAAQLLPSPSLAQIEALDQWFIQQNLSPGGCADLLAAVYFVHELTKS